MQSVNPVLDLIGAVSDAAAVYVEAVKHRRAGFHILDRFVSAAVA